VAGAHRQPAGHPPAQVGQRPAAILQLDEDASDPRQQGFARLSGRTPSWCSSVAIRLLTAGWVRQSRSAASEKEPVAATVAKAFSACMSIGYGSYEKYEFV